MNVHQDQIQPSAKYYGPEMHMIEQEGREIPSTVVSESDKHEYDWADVLKELEPYY